MTRHAIDRRHFLKTTGAVGLGLSLGGLRVSPALAAAPAAPEAAKLGWQLASSLYTFRRFPFYEALDLIAKLGFSVVEPAFFLPLSKDRPGLNTNEALSAEVRAEMKKKMADHGIQMTNYYAEFPVEEGPCRKIFDFAKEMGVATIVSEPTAAQFDLIEKLCEEYAISLAVHNHPKSPQSKYWNPENVLAVCKGRGKRIGACCDTGHWIRSGLDPLACLKQMEGRVLGFHLKDVQEAKVDARDVPLGASKFNYGAVLEELHRQGYRGITTIEYEHDSPQLVDDVAQCIAFVDKTAKRLGK